MTRMMDRDHRAKRAAGVAGHPSPREVVGKRVRAKKRMEKMGVARRAHPGASQSAVVVSREQ